METIRFIIVFIIDIMFPLANNYYSFLHLNYYFLKFRSLCSVIAYYLLKLHYDLANKIT